MSVHFYFEWLTFDRLELGRIQKVIFWVIPRSGAVMWFINILAIFWSFRVFGWFDYFLASLRWTCPDGTTSSGPFGHFLILELELDFAVSLTLWNISGRVKRIFLWNLVVWAFFRRNRISKWNRTFWIEIKCEVDHMTDSFMCWWWWNGFWTWPPR